MIFQRQSMLNNANSRISKSGFHAFRCREYRYFWLAASFSNIGMWTLIYGRLWLMHDLTESPLMVGLVTTSSLGPVLVFSMWGGVLADRVNRLKLIRVTRAMFAILALVTGVLKASDVIEPWHLIAISVGTGILLSFDIPSRAAMLPSLVPREHLASAVALYSLVFGAAAIVGPIFFAPLVGLWGIEGLFFLITASYILTVVALARMESRGHRPESRPSTLVQGLTQGFRYIRGQRVIASVIILGMVVGVFGISFETLLPVIADKVITGGIDTYGRLLLAAGVGGLVATISVVVLGTRVHPARYYVVSGTALGVGLLLLSRVTWFPGAAIAIGLIGSCHVIFMTMGTTMLQSLTADEFRGRVMSIQQFTWGAMAIGALLMGALGEGVSVPFALRLGGLVVAFATVFAALFALRRVLAADSGTPISTVPIHPTG